MKTSDIINETYSALIANKARTVLTMLGIVIGIGSVIAMVAIGQGAQASITASIESIGSNLLIVQPGAQRGPGEQISSGRGSSRTLTQSDADAIVKDISLAKAVAPELTSRYQVTAKGTNTNTSVVGTNNYYPDVRNIKMAEGVFISDLNLKNLSRVAVLGPTVRDDLFGSSTDTGTSAVGSAIRINETIFKVVGVTESKGGTGFGNQDDVIFIPLTVAQQFLAGGTYLSSISIQVADTNSMTEAQTEITNLLLKQHKIKDLASADFSVLNQNDIVQTASSITQTFTILLGAVAGISLLVGGIGIMNMMLTTVTERTREIGLRKAIGAKKRDISLQFLSEAVALTFLGGFVGIILGSIISFGVTHFGILETKVSVGSILLAFGVSAAIGIIFGYYPASRAAKLNPIDALRYE
ncbi:MAG: ABC transporter permease [Candidatus Zambryskibacteria bacterium]